MSAIDVTSSFILAREISYPTWGVSSDCAEHEWCVLVRHKRALLSDPRIALKDSISDSLASQVATCNHLYN